MRRLALVATLLLPIMLLHARAGAEICIAVVDLSFLANLAMQFRDARVSRDDGLPVWLLIALAWWGWEVICSLPLPAFGLGAAGWPGLLQALALLRLILLAAALQNWVLATPASRRAVWLAIALSVVWIGLESWQQYLTGRNLFGDRRWLDGALTGPFWEPRAGAPYAHLLCTALLPVAIPLLARKRRLAAVALAILALATSILIGQRMPSMLALLSLGLSCLFIKSLRPAAAIAVAAGAVLLAATPIISPPTYAKLVLHFAYQMRSFPVSPYGELYTRAATMGLASLWHGYGFNGFKTLCGSPSFASGFPALGIAPTSLALGACNMHPHNFYLQAFTDAGLPGLMLFAALNLAWLKALGRFLWRNPDPLRVGLFAGVFTYAWPLASTDSFATLPHAGWLFLMLGLGLAAAQISATQPEPQHG